MPRQFNEERIVSSDKSCWDNWLSFGKKKKKLDPLPHIVTKINSKWISALNVTANTIKLIEEHIGINLHNLGLGSGLWDMKVQAAKEKLDKIIFIKI